MPPASAFSSCRVRGLRDRGRRAGIITNLVIISAAAGHVTYWDIALRDFGLLIGALALARLGAFVHQRTGTDVRGRA